METVVDIKGTVDLGPIAEKVGARLDVIDGDIKAGAARLSSLAADVARSLNEGEVATAAQFAAQAARIAELEKLIATVRLTACEFNLVDAGCRANDPAFDNGPLINAALARCGGNPGKEAGWINTSLYLPGGGWFVKTPLATPTKTGLRVRGNGLAHGLNENHYYSPGLSGMGGPASRLIYVGPASEPALRLNGVGEIWDGICLQRGVFQNPTSKTVVDAGSVGLAVAGRDQPPTGKHGLRSLALANFDRAIVLSNRPDATHADESLVGHVWFENCKTAVYCDANIQALNWVFQKVEIGWGVERVYDAPRGGAIVFDHVALMSPALVFRCNPENNTGSYKIGWLHVDNMAKGWRLIETTSANPICLRVSGFMQSKATPGERPVVIGHKTPDVVIDLHDGSIGRPWDWRRGGL